MTLPKPSDGFSWVQETWGMALRCTPLAAVARHCFSTRDLSPEGVRDEEHAGWDALARCFDVGLDKLVRLRQVHCANVYQPSNGTAPARYEDWPEADIAVTRDRSLVLSVRTADCVPILLADGRTGAIAAVHAGWRGTAAGAAVTAVRALKERFGAEPPDVVAAIGPSIGPCCYEVGPEVVPRFSSHPEAGRWFSAHTRPRLNLWRATRDQLERAGVPASQIYSADLCTAYHPRLFHSYRRDGQGTGRLVAAIRSAPDTKP